MRCKRCRKCQSCCHNHTCSASLLSASSASVDRRNGGDRNNAADKLEETPVWVKARVVTVQEQRIDHPASKGGQAHTERVNRLTVDLLEADAALLPPSFPTEEYRNCARQTRNRRSPSGTASALSNHPSRAIRMSFRYVLGRAWNLLLWVDGCESCCWGWAWV
jgi:hypothetical protein